MSPPHPIPDAFTQKKSAILSSLSAPPDAYTDLSPKGNVDLAIRDLIDRINRLGGIVTTSSCSGRVSVFLEGKKKNVGGDRQDIKGAVPGGKGLGGQWLFVSHEPVDLGKISGSVWSLLGLEPMSGAGAAVPDRETDELRLARFQFEPMILHIMTASLHYAQRVLAAAINAGFRESGVQSLKNLEDVNSFPMVAVRSSGLALESIIGGSHKVEQHEDTHKEEKSQRDDLVESYVDERHLKLLLNLANARFKTNDERIKRFEEELFQREPKHEGEWEDANVRRERKRAEGLQKQKASGHKATDEGENEMSKTNVVDGRCDEYDTLLGFFPER